MTRHKCIVQRHEHFSIGIDSRLNVLRGEIPTDIKGFALDLLLAFLSECRPRNVEAILK